MTAVSIDINSILQWAAVAVIVAIAVAWAIGRARRRRRAAECGLDESGSCPDCPLAEKCNPSSHKKRR